MNNQDKMGVISIQLNYQFKQEKDNKAIKAFLHEVELPSGYEMDTFEYIGIWNNKTEEWEEE
jgi:hypothetical protein